MDNEEENESESDMKLELEHSRVQRPMFFQNFKISQKLIKN